MLNVKGKTALVTGGSLGIGTATVRVFAEKGIRTFFTSRQHRKEAEAIAKETGATAFYGDLSSLEGAEAAAREFLNLAETADILVHNAGIWTYGEMGAFPAEIWRETMTVNLDAVFALTNAGVKFSGELLAEAATHSVAIGIFLGLVAGKFLGITLFSYGAVRLGMADFPVGMGFRHVAGVGLLGGIGFTMSIFISDLSFGKNPGELIVAKTAILVSSLTAGILGILWLLFVHWRDTRRQMVKGAFAHGV